MYFRNYRPRQTCLDKCLKTAVWEAVSTVDIVNKPKHWFNLNESAFILLSDHSEGNWVAKVALRHNEYSSDLFLTHWLLMTSIPLIVKTSECKQFRCFSLKNKKFFPQFFSAFFESALNFEHFQKKMTLIADVFPKLPTTKDVLR